MEDIRSLETGLINAFVLLVLGECATHKQELRERLMAYDIATTGAGLDRALGHLEASGLLERAGQPPGSRLDGPVYALSGAGRRELDRLATAMADLGVHLDRFLRVFGGGEP